MTKKFETLRLVSILLKIMGYIFLVFGIVSFITLAAGSYLLVELSYGKGIFGGIITLVFSIFMFIFLYYLSEIGLFFIELYSKLDELCEKKKG